MSELDQIKARLQAATPGPWEADTGVRGDCVVWGPNGRFLMNAQAEPHWIEYPGEKRSVSFDVDRRDAEFIAHARTDVPALLALVRAQQAKLDAAADLISEWEKFAGPGSQNERVFGKQVISVELAVNAIRAAIAATEEGK